jgi:hypothetical protein
MVPWHRAFTASLDDPRGLANLGCSQRAPVAPERLSQRRHFFPAASH